MFRSENNLATSLTISSREDEAVLQRAWWPCQVIIVICHQDFGDDCDRYAVNMFMAVNVKRPCWRTLNHHLDPDDHLIWYIDGHRLAALDEGSNHWLQLVRGLVHLEVVKYLSSKKIPPIREVFPNQKCMLAITCFFRLTSSEFSDSLERKGSSWNWDGSSPCQGH